MNPMFLNGPTFAGSSCVAMASVSHGSLLIRFASNLAGGEGAERPMLYINWLLSRAGQTVWQQRVKQPSLRIDIPKDGLLEFNVPKPGIKYVSAGTETYGAVADNEINDLINRTLAKKKGF